MQKRCSVIDTPSTLNDAYQESKLLHEQHKPSWSASIHKIIENIPKLKDNYKSKEKIRNIIKDSYIKLWENQLSNNSEGKLRTFVKFKTSHGFENYLSLISNFEWRRSLTQLRVSSHHLRIESGRYQGIPPHLRHCLHCDSEEVEDEMHFLITCTNFVGERQELFDIISKTCHNFINLNNNEKFFWLMTCEDKAVLHNLCSFIKKNCK